MTLFLIVKSDIQQLGVHLFNGGNALKSKNTQNRHEILEKLKVTLNKIFLL